MTNTPTLFPSDALTILDQCYSYVLRNPELDTTNTGTGNISISLNGSTGVLIYNGPVPAEDIYEYELVNLSILSSSILAWGIQYPSGDPGKPYPLFYSVDTGNVRFIVGNQSVDETAAPITIWFKIIG